MNYFCTKCSQVLSEFTGFYNVIAEKHWTLMHDSETDTPHKVQCSNESSPNEMSVGVITNLPEPVLHLHIWQIERSKAQGHSSMSQVLIYYYAFICNQQKEAYSQAKKDLNRGPHRTGWSSSILKSFLLYCPCTVHALVPTETHIMHVHNAFVSVILVTFAVCKMSAACNQRHHYPQ